MRGLNADERSCLVWLKLSLCTGEERPAKPAAEPGFTPSYIANPPFPYVSQNSGDQHITSSYYPYPPKRISDTLKKTSVTNGTTCEDGKILRITWCSFSFWKLGRSYPRIEQITPLLFNSKLFFFRIGFESENRKFNGQRFHRDRTSKGSIDFCQFVWSDMWGTQRCKGRCVQTEEAARHHCAQG